MDEYLTLLVLAYFKQYKDKYDLFELKELVGVPFEILKDTMDTMFEEGLLCIDKDLLIAISFKGRLRLMNSKMDSYCFNTKTVDSVNSYSVDDIYDIRSFSCRKWRGNRS